LGEVLEKQFLISFESVLTGCVAWLCICMFTVYVDAQPLSERKQADSVNAFVLVERFGISHPDQLLFLTPEGPVESGKVKKETDTHYELSNALIGIRVPKPVRVWPDTRAGDPAPA
jgi:hypothetical protein